MTMGKITIGEQVKKLRNERQLSQPQLSEKAGIEQSYLSKLENDKSVPSNEVFRQLLTAFEISLDDFVKDFDLKAERVHLSQIPDIAAWFLEQDSKSISGQRRYLYICSALLVLAVTFFYAGFSKSIFDETVYRYYSPGVVLEGEPKNVFKDWRLLIEDDHKDWHKLRAVKKVEMNSRSDEVYLTVIESRGESFVLPVEGGSRYYYNSLKDNQPRAINAWLQVLGVFMFASGIMGFVLERRFYR